VYERQRITGPYPPLCLQLFAHNVKHSVQVTIYINHAAELMQFARDQRLEWLELQIVQAYRQHKPSRPNHTPKLK
jgi:hypothetical protein